MQRCLTREIVYVILPDPVVPEAAVVAGAGAAVVAELEPPSTTLARPDTSLQVTELVTSVVEVHWVNFLPLAMKARMGSLFMMISCFLTPEFCLMTNL